MKQFLSLKALFVLTVNNLLILSIFSFLLIASTALSLSVGEPLREKVLADSSYIQEVDMGELSDLPVLQNKKDIPMVSSQGVLVLDLDSRISLYEKNPGMKFFPASVTKMATALVASEGKSFDDIVKVGRFTIEGQKMGLYEGEEIRRGDLVKGLLIKSANDAAEALAMLHEGGRDKFIFEMNTLAKKLNMLDTNFSNPSGIDDVNQTTTARDLVKLSEALINDDKLSEIVKTKRTSVSDIQGKVVHNLLSTNELLESVEGVLGVKTGWTEMARENLVTYIERDGRRLIIVVLASQDRFGETRRLINWIFSNYTWVKV